MARLNSSSELAADEGKQCTVHAKSQCTRYPFDKGKAFMGKAVPISVWKPAVKMWPGTSQNGCNSSFLQSHQKPLSQTSAARLQLGLVALLGPVVPGGMSPAAGLWPCGGHSGSVDHKSSNQLPPAHSHQTREAVGPSDDTPVDVISNSHISSKFSRSKRISLCMSLEDPRKTRYP